MSPQEVVDACRAWCALTGVDPVVHNDEWWVVLAVVESRTPFAKLNGTQRRFIAGVSDGKIKGYANAK